MERTSLSVALIRKTYNQSLQWLARLDPKTKKLTFVVSERLGKESFREATTREVAWELRLDRQRDFLVANMAQMNLEFIDQLPDHRNKCHVTVSFYNVEIYRKDVVKSLEEDPNNFWVTSEEICDGKTQCGRVFHPLIPYLVARSNVIQYWESSSQE